MARSPMNRRAFLCWASLAVAMLGGPAHGAEKLTLPDAIARALASNPVLRSRAVEVEKREMEQAIARGERLPRIDLIAGYTRYRYPTLVTPIRRPGAFPPFDQDIANVGAALALPLYAGGKLVAGESLAAHTHEASREALRSVGQDLIFNVTSTYTKALHLRDLQRASASRIKTLEAEEKNTALRLGEGRASRLDLMRLQTQLSQSRHDVLSIAQAEQDALSLLAVLLGQAGTLPPLAETAALNAALPGSQDEAIALALAQHPELGKAQALGQAAADKLDIARGDLRPQINLVGRLQQTAGDDLRLYDSSHVGVQMALPLFDGAVRKHRIDQASLEWQQSRLALEDAANQLRSEVRQAYGAVEEAGSRRAVSRQAEREAQEALRIETLRYGQGEGSITDLLSAETALWSAVVSRLQAGYDGIVTQVRLLRAMGGLSAANLKQASVGSRAVLSQGEGQP